MIRAPIYWYKLASSLGITLLMVSFHLGCLERVFSVGSTVSLLSPGLKLIFTRIFEVGGKGKDVSSTKSFGRYIKYLPSVLLDMLPTP